jgi:hypothetical protein
VDDGPKSFRQTRLQSGMGQNEAKSLWQAAIDRLEVAFES